MKLLRTAACAAAILCGGTAGAASEPKKEAEPAEGADAAAASPEASDHYVHRWIPMPAVAGLRLPVAGDGEAELATLAARKGRAFVVLFLASHSVASQQFLPDFLKLVQRYKRLDVDFVYVFKNDTREDAEGFMKEFGLPAGVLATRDMLKAFHNPSMPAVYVGDRRGWLVARHEEMGKKELGALDELLRLVTAL